MLSLWKLFFFLVFYEIQKILFPFMTGFKQVTCIRKKKN